MVKRAPALAAVMADEGAWYFDRKGEIPPGKKGYYPIPVFNFFEGYLSVNFSDNYYFLSQRHEEVRLGGLYPECCPLCHLLPPRFFQHAQQSPPPIFLHQVPRLSDQQLQAIKLFNELAASPEIRMDYILKVGTSTDHLNHASMDG